VLVIDDSMTMRLVLKRWLTDAGYEVVLAEDGLRALDFLEKEVFDLLTCDAEMPGVDGFELCAKLRQMEAAAAQPHVPVIFITAHDQLSDRQRGFDVGATDFMPKPPKEEEFLARVERLLRPAHKLSGLTALVVEDSSVTRKIVSSVLRENGLRVLEASNGEEAYRILVAQGSTLDLMITDYEMPVMDGKELCSRARSSLGLAWLPIIFLSGLSETNYILDLFSAGATDYIIKPFTREELMARILVHVEIRKLSQERVRRIEEMEQLQRVKDSVLSVASSDLRAPLNAIIGQANLVLMDQGLPAAIRDPLEIIRNSGNWLASMVEDLMVIARHEMESQNRMEFVPTDLTEIVDYCVNVMVHLAMPKGIHLAAQVECRAEHGRIIGNRSSLVRMLNNLLSNAIKFTPLNGLVELRLSREPDHKVRLVVKDNGGGIPPELLPGLFKPLSRAVREAQGTAGERLSGLGPAIVKEIVDQHFGSITVSSTLGQGTEFTVEFPGVD
jgi:CheY-like chemotaxis protein